MVGFAIVALTAATLLATFRLTGPLPPPLAAPIDPRYPDLGMAALTNLLVGEDPDGRTFLRFSATLVNVGGGPLLVAAHRPFPLTDDWLVVQRVEDAAGGYSELETRARLVFGGDAHDHWHVVGAEAHELETLGGETVGGLVKTGFCFFDNVDHATDLPRSPPQATHSSSECGAEFDRDIAMGLSVGWGDEYQWYLLDQTIEITSVADGRYRLRAVADPADLFREESETNNDTWTMVELKTVDGRRLVEIVSQGPSA